MAFNYKNLTPGLHAITARAIDLNGDYNDSTATFSALRFNSTFIADTTSVDVSEISAFEALDNNRFKLSGIEVEGSKWNLVIGWNRATQGFEIEQISPLIMHPLLAIGGAREQALHFRDVVPQSVVR